MNSLTIRFSFPTIDQLASIPEEEVWLASQKSARTRRAYKLDVAHFMRTLGITSPDMLRQVRSQGVVLTDEELSHVAPLRWDHIALTGDYLWSNVDTPRERFRPLRTSRFRPDALRTPQAA